MSGIMSEKCPEISTFFKMSGKCPENVRKMPGKCPKNVRIFFNLRVGGELGASWGQLVANLLQWEGPSKLNDRIQSDQI